MLVGTHAPFVNVILVCDFHFRLCDILHSDSDSDTSSFTRFNFLTSKDYFIIVHQNQQFKFTNIKITSNPETKQWRKILPHLIRMTNGTRTWLISPSSQVTIFIPLPPAYPPHSVPDLHHLLTARGHQLDYQLYSQTDILHNTLRKVMTTYTTRI